MAGLVYSTENKHEISIDVVVVEDLGGFKATLSYVMILLWLEDERESKNYKLLVVFSVSFQCLSVRIDG